MPADSPADEAKSELKQSPAGPLGWLIDPRPRRMLLPITGLWVLGLDWLLFSSNIALTGGLATPLIVVLGFVLGGAGTLFFQKYFAQDATWKALLKALVIGVLVGAPWPLAGTLVGGWVLLAAGIGKSGKPSDRSAN